MRCAKCEYDLRRHSSGDRCPECGLAVDETVRILRERAADWIEIKAVGFGMWCIALFIGGVAAWFFIFGSAWNGVSHAYRAAAICSAIAIALGAIGGWVWPTRMLLWSTIFSWPALLAGVTCASRAPIEGQAIVLWLAFGFAMLLAGFGGAWIGRRARSCRTIG